MHHVCPVCQLCIAIRELLHHPYVLHHDKSEVHEVYSLVPCCIGIKHPISILVAQLVAFELVHELIHNDAIHLYILAPILNNQGMLVSLICHD